MRPTRWPVVICLSAIATISALGGSPALAGSAPAAHPNQASFDLVHGCYGLRSQALGRFVAKSEGGGYAASADVAPAAEPFRMQATALGHYLFYGPSRDFLAAGGLGGRVEAATRASPEADWRVDAEGPGSFTITLPAAGRVLAAAGAGGELVLAESAASAGDAARFSFEPVEGCADFPEVDVSAVGAPSEGPTHYGETAGLLDAHMHMMAYQFLGGSAHCGRPWHPYGVEYALVDCPDHQPNGAGAVLENVLFGSPARTHDPVGWPTFKDWPHHASLTHEGSYYKWLERAWLGGLRVYVNLFVENGALCELYPLKRNSCDEMESVRLQARNIRELEDYIDAQSGGPGRGWFRIVTDPFQARRVINDGKLAVVLGIEISRLFQCRIYNEVPQCDKAQIERQLDEVYDLGVRDMELINKFDNALGGVAGDSGETGVVVNSGNRYETGKYWELRTCDPANGDHVHDREQIAGPASGRDSLVGNGIQAFLPPGSAPVYPDPPHCNTRGLSDLGEHLVNRMMDRGMIIDPDHLSVLARQQLLSLVEARRYSGIVSSHSWSTADAYPRIYDLGGVVTPYAGGAEGFVEKWRQLRPEANERFYFGFGYGADMNGFGAQGGPREGAENPVTYPFKSFDGAVTLFQQRSGERVFDINTDGVAHYGLYPDWVEDLRKIAGDRIVDDMARGPEAYLQMWERAVGIRAAARRPTRWRFRGGSLGRLRLGDASDTVLRRAGQPERRVGRAFTYRLRGKRNRGARLAAVFTPAGALSLVASTSLGHRAYRVGRRTRVRRLVRRTRRFGRAARRVGPGVFVAPAGRGARYVWRVRGGRVRYVAVATRAAARNGATLRRSLRLTGLR